MNTVRFVLAFVMVLPWASAALAATQGEEVYQKRCAVCHEQVNDRIPPRSALQKMPAASILRALDAGAMMAVAFTMSRDDRVAVATYLGTSDTPPGPSPTAFCADRAVRLPAAPTTSWIGWSPGSNNARFQSGPQAGLTVDQVRRLKLRWAFGFAGDTSAFAPPTVIDGQMFVGSAGGVIHAMRAESGCLQWTFQANGPVRSSIVVVPRGGQHALLFGDMTGWFYAVAAETGQLLWKIQVETHDSTRLTAGPIAYDGTVYVPVASWEETRAADLDYPCCTFRGSVVALRISDGRQLWKTWMTDAPVERGKNARGIMRYGPSGVGVWATPTLDVKRNLLYIATGDNYSEPATDMSDAVIALDRATGRVVWSRQLTENDVYNGSCAAIPEGCGPDFDFGDSPILIQAPDGRELLLAGQKSGIVWGLDPAKQGGSRVADARRRRRHQRRRAVGHGDRRAAGVRDGIRRQALAEPEPDGSAPRRARPGGRRRTHRASRRRRPAGVARRGDALPGGPAPRLQSRSTRRGDRDSRRGVRHLSGRAHPRARCGEWRAAVGLRYDARVRRRQRREGARRVD